MTTKARWLSIGLSSALMVLLSSCVPALDMMEALVDATTYDTVYVGTAYDTSYDAYTYSLEVENNCGGADEFVNVYVDGVYYGVVYANYTFYGIPYGSHVLMAEGTDYGGSTFSESYVADDDYVWTLC